MNQKFNQVSPDTPPEDMGPDDYYPERDGATMRFAFPSIVPYEGALVGVASRAALRTYARVIGNQNPEYARWLEDQILEAERHVAERAESDKETKPAEDNSA